MNPFLHQRSIHFGLCCCGFLLFVLWACNHSSKMMDQKSEHQVQASVLYQAFIDDEVKAKVDFNNKVLEVVGSVKKINIDESQQLTLVLDSKNELGNVLCKMEPPSRNLISKLRLGDAIKVKGQCVGFRLDLILHHCVLM
ncbi:MAG: hypothetical protein AAF985_24115 [Bacteroidota bacterium]